jgi:hypothetical protein
MPFLQEMAKYKEKPILWFDLRIFTAIQICLKYVKVPKSLDPTVGVYSTLTLMAVAETQGETSF